MDPAKESSGTFSGKALIRDVEAGKSQVVNINVRASGPSKIRMDVTSTIGTHLFSLAMQDQKVEYIIVPEKKHFSGAASAEALRPVLKIPLDPSLIYNIMFERAIESRLWSCTQSEGRLAGCRAMRSGTTIEWAKPKEDGRLVEIKSKAVTVQLNIKEYSRSIKDEDKAFTLKVPDKFLKQKI